MTSETPSPEVEQVDWTFLEYRDALYMLDLSEEEAARLFHVPEDTSKRWFGGEETVPRSVRIALWLMLKHKVKPDAIPDDTYIPAPPLMLTINEKLWYMFDGFLRKLGLRNLDGIKDQRGIVMPRTRAEVRAVERMMQQPPRVIYWDSRSPTSHRTEVTAITRATGFL